MKIERMNKGSWGKVRAFFDLTTSEGFTIKGFKIIEGINGLFVSMPSQKSNDGEYYDSVFASKELRDELNQIALDNYGSQFNETLEPMEEKRDATPDDAPPEEDSSNNVVDSKEAVKQEPFSEDDIPF